MKIYEKPSVDVKTFDVQDVINASAYNSFDSQNTKFGEITGNTDDKRNGVVFQW